MLLIRDQWSEVSMYGSIYSLSCSFYCYDDQLILHCIDTERTVTAGRAFQWTRDKTGFKWTGTQ
jgi:hypothetical protein